MPPGACLSLRWGREDGKTALSGPYDRPGVRCGRPGSLRIPRIPRIRDKWPGSEANQPPEPRKSRRRGPSEPLRPTSTPLENRPSAVPATHLDKTPALDGDPLQPLNFNSENPNPQRPYGPPLSPSDRHAPESVIGLSELVIGIVGIRISAGTPPKHANDSSSPWMTTPIVWRS